jgi:hypothetical protein
VRRAVCIVALAASSCLGGVARGEPCPTSTVMRQGVTAPCTGVLVPARRVADCLASEDELTACRVRADGAARVAAEDALLARRTLEAMEARLASEVEACRASQVPARTDWWPVVIGVVGGLVVGGLVGALVGR